MLKRILIFITLILAFLAVAIARRPSHFHIERSALIATSPENVFKEVNDLHHWEARSPWAKMDPAAKTSYAGPKTGIGAGFSWAGNDKVGVGTMTITDSRKNEYIRFRLDFLKPMKGTNTAQFTFKPEGKSTIVTWSMDGESNFVAKAFSLFINCDKMVGGQFEKGLMDLKVIAEAK